MHKLSCNSHFLIRNPISPTLKASQRRHCRERYNFWRGCMILAGVAGMVVISWFDAFSIQSDSRSIGTNSFSIQFDPQSIGTDLLVFNLQ